MAILDQPPGDQLQGRILACNLFAILSTRDGPKKHWRGRQWHPAAITRHQGIVHVCFREREQYLVRSIGLLLSSRGTRCYFSGCRHLFLFRMEFLTETSVPVCRSVSAASRHSRKNCSAASPRHTETRIDVAQGQPVAEVAAGRAQILRPIAERPATQYGAS